MTGKELKALRESLGLSRRQVAIILDVSESTVKHCENDIRSNDAYVKGIKLLHDGLTQTDNRVKSGLYADWRTNPKAHLKALKDAVEAERERCAKLCESNGMARGGEEKDQRYVGYVITDVEPAVKNGAVHEGMGYAALIREGK